MKPVRLAGALLGAFVFFGFVLASGNIVPLPAFSMLAFFVLAGWATTSVGVYLMKSKGDLVYFTDRKQSLNYARPLFQTRKGKSVGSVSIWSFGGWSWGVPYQDRRHAICREGLEPRPMAPGSRVYISRGIPVAINDIAFEGRFPSQRTSLNTHGHSKYSPRKAGRGRLFAVLLSPEEGDTTAMGILEETFIRAVQVAIHRRRAKDPKVADALRKAGKRNRAEMFFAGKDDQQEIESERTKEGFSE